MSDYRQTQCFLDAIDPRSHQNVEPQIREEDTWDKIVQLSKQYDATMYVTQSAIIATIHCSEVGYCLFGISLVTYIP